jgi:hypothetical protein
VTDAIEFAEFFDVDVDQFAGMFALRCAGRLHAATRSRLPAAPTVLGYPAESQ